MIKHAQQVAVAEQGSMSAAPADNAADEHIAPAPRVSVQAFCESVETAAAVQAEVETGPVMDRDRRRSFVDRGLYRHIRSEGGSGERHD